ncbi:MAG: hypothetical protein EOP84_13390, partial [Verrucomicrobiaceae bacterium]
MKDRTKTIAKVLVLTVHLGAVTHLTVQSYYWRKGGGSSMHLFSLGDSTIACHAGFTSYDRATWKYLRSHAARRGSTWNTLSVRNGKALAVGFHSEKADWHVVFF